MMPLHTSFRRTLRRTIPQLSYQELDRYESLISLINHLKFETSRGQEPPQQETKSNEENPISPDRASDGSLGETPVLPDPISDIDLITGEANEILEPYEKQYRHSHRLWVARRQLAVQQGNFLQIPYTWRSFRLFLWAIWNYRRVQAVTAPVLAWNRFKYFVKGMVWWQISLLLVLLGLLSYSAYFVIKGLAGLSIN